MAVQIQKNRKGIEIFLLQLWNEIMNGPYLLSQSWNEIINRPKFLSRLLNPIVIFCFWFGAVRRKEI